LSPVDIGIIVEASGTGSVSQGYHAYYWDSASETWTELDTTYDTATGMVHFISDKLGRFALTTSIRKVYLPIAISGSN
jgi:hypothetical protein